MNKYHNTPTMVQLAPGVYHRFDSRKEAERYKELLAMLKAGSIRNLRLQPHYSLVEPFLTPTGEKIRREEYVADFAFERVTGPDAYGQRYWVPVVEDVKGIRTPVYLSKKNRMLEKYGIRVEEI